MSNTIKIIQRKRGQELNHIPTDEYENKPVELQALNKNSNTVVTTYHNNK